MVFSERQKLAEEIIFLSEKRGIIANDLRADEGRETEALNCKPITNLKEKSELSNYCKPAVFVCTLLAPVLIVLLILLLSRLNK
jgi:hypothetical protein